MAEFEPKATARLLGKRISSYQGTAPSLLKLASLTGLALLLWLHLASPWMNDVWVGLLGLAGLIVLAAVSVWFRMPRRVDLYQHGIEYVHWGRPRRIYWNQLSEIYQQRLWQLSTLRHDGQDWLYQLVCRDGGRIRLHHLEGVRDLGRRIEQQFAARHLPMVLSAFSTGYTIRFGRRLTVNTDGLHDGNRFVPWHEVSEIALGIDDELRITCLNETSPAVRIPCRQIANLRILDGLLEAIRVAETEAVESDPDPIPHRSLFAESSVSFAAAGEESQEANVADVDWDEPDERLPARPRQPR